MKHKVLDLLNCLSKKEIRRFEVFLNSPYFNTNERIITLLKARKLADKDFQEIHKALFPNTPYNKQVLKNLLSKLMALLKKFLAVQFVESDASIQDAFGLEVAKGKLKEQLLKNFKPSQTESLITQHEQIFSIKERLLELEIEKLLIQQKPISVILKKIEAYFLLSKVIQSYKLIKQKNLLLQVKRRLDSKELKELEALSEESIDITLVKSSQLLKGYYQASLLMQSPSEVNYTTLKRYLTEHTKDIHFQHYQEIQVILENYCIQKVNKGQISYREELYDLLKRRIEISPNQQIEDALIRNFITVGCRIGKNQEVEELLEYNKGQISFNVYNYSKAVLAFYNKDFEHSLSMLGVVIFTTIEYQIRVRLLMITNLYALQEYQVVLYQIETFRIWLLRQKNIKQTNKKNTTNYLKFMKRLIYIKEQEKFQKRALVIANKKELLFDIENCDKLVSKRILLTLIGEDLN